MLNLLTKLSVVGDDLPDEWKSATFEPVAGMVLDQSKPTVRSITVNSLEEAVWRYNTLTGRDITTSTQNDTWKMDDVGTLTYTALNQGDCFATIDIHMKQLPKLTQLRLIPVSAMGTNGSFKKPPYYHFGDVVKDKEGCHWICVRPAYSPSGKEETHWFSFQMGKENITNINKSGCKKQSVQTKLKKDNEHMFYLAQLMGALANPGKFLKAYGENGNINDKSSFGGLPAGAMTNNEMNRQAMLWYKLGIWNLVKPKSIEDEIDLFHRSFLKDDVTFFYDGYYTSGKYLKLPYMTYSGAPFYKKPKKGSELVVDMTTENFSANSFYHEAGYKLNNAQIPLNAFLVRYKTGYQLSTNWIQTPDPTAPIPGVTDVHVFNKLNNESIDDMSPITDKDKVVPGHVIGNDGNFYNNRKSCHAATNQEIVAMVVYNGEAGDVDDFRTQYRGLAIGIEEIKPVAWANQNSLDAYCGKVITEKNPKYEVYKHGIYTTAEMASGCQQQHKHPAAEKCLQYDAWKDGHFSRELRSEKGLSDWFIASTGQWIMALRTMGVEWDNGKFTNDDKFGECANFLRVGEWFEKAGLYPFTLQSRWYWTSDNFDKDHACHLMISTGQKIYFSNSETPKTSQCTVRPFIAF
jgi:hypothetical protein